MNKLGFRKWPVVIDIIAIFKSCLPCKQKVLRIYVAYNSASQVWKFTFQKTIRDYNSYFMRMCKVI